MASPKRRRRLLICLLAATAAVLALGLLILILSLTVFKPKHPAISVNNIAISDLDFSFDAAKFRLHLNLSLAANVTVRNPNRVGFKYFGSIAILRFRGGDVGEIPIPASAIGARDARNLNLTLALMTDRLIFDADFYREAISGVLQFQTFIKLPGKVRLLFDFRVVSYTTCDLEVHLYTRMVLNQTCHYRIKV